MRAVVFSFIGTMMIVSSPVLSQSLYKWIDDDGNVTYQDSPPPDGSNFEEQDYAGSESSDSDENSDDELDDEFDDGESDQQALNEISDANPVSFYSVESCDSCDLVRLFLENNGIPFAEKDIKTNVTLQQELQDRSGGLQVPTVIVGDKIVDGYSKSALRDALEEKGYSLGSGAESSTAATEASDQLTGSQLEELTNVFDEAEQQLEDAELEEEPLDDSVFDSDEDTFEEDSFEDDGLDDESVIEIESES